MTSVSVAMATYNGGRFVAEQLRSILDQGLPPLEVVVSDDGSTDDTLEVIRRVAAEHPAAIPVRVIDGPRLGVSGNFARAVEATTGDLIALSDQDDVWHPDRLARAVAAFEGDDSLLLRHGDARLVDAGGAPVGGTLFEFLPVTAAERAEIGAGRAFDAYLRRNLATGATVVFRRSLLERALPFPAEWVHDEWLAILAAATGGVSVETEPLIDYRQHGANEIGVRRPTLRYKLGRMLEPRGTRYADFAVRWRLLVERLESVGAPAEKLAAARERAEFERVRAGYPAARLRRIRPVLREWRRGSYARYSSQGNLDVVRDLLQPV